MLAHPLIVEYWQEVIEPLLTRLRWRPFEGDKRRGFGKRHRGGELFLDRAMYKMGITLLNGIGVAIPLLATIDSVNKKQSKKLQVVARGEDATPARLTIPSLQVRSRV